MSMRILWEENVVILRDCAHLAGYREKYWSMNEAVFRKMRNSDSSKFDGKAAIVDFTEHKTIVDSSEFGEFGMHTEKGWVTLAGTMEALHVGVDFPSLIRELGQVLAPGSIASPNERDFFCPLLFPLGSIVSIGIKLLSQKDGAFIIPALTRILVLSKA